MPVTLFSSFVIYLLQNNWNASSTFVCILPWWLVMHQNVEKVRGGFREVKLCVNGCKEERIIELVLVALKASFNNQ